MDQTALVVVAFIVLCIIGGIVQEATGDTDIFNREGNEDEH